MVLLNKCQAYPIQTSLRLVSWHSYRATPIQRAIFHVLFLFIRFCCLRCFESPNNWRPENIQKTMTNLSFQIKPLLFLFSCVLLCFVQKHVIFNISKTERKPLSRIKPLFFYFVQKKKRRIKV